MTIAYKGNEKIESESQLKSLISELPKSDNFGLFLGAGASKCAGGMLMDEVWEIFKEKYEESYNLLLSENYLMEDDENLNKYKIISKILDKLREIIDKNGKPNKLTYENAQAVIGDLERVFVRAAVLNERLWGIPPEKINESGELNTHVQVLQKIHESRLQGQPAPRYFTLNYDLSLEWAAKHLRYQVVNGFQGGNKRIFNAKSFDLDLTESKLISDTSSIGNYTTVHVVKLHGSLTWTVRGNEIEELQEFEAFDELNKFIMREGKSRIPNLMIMPSGSMYKRIRKSPHKELLNQLDKFLAKPNPAMIIVGYGHSDAHINEKFLSALSQNTGLRLAVYFPDLTNIKDRGSLPVSLQRMIEMENSNFIVVGGGNDAHFDAFAKHL